MWRWFKRLQSQPGGSVPTIWIPANLLDRTVELLRQSGLRSKPHEGVAYWAGRRTANEYFVTTCIVPEARTTPGSFETSSRSNAKVIMYLAQSGLELLGQVHSHPGSFVDHSDGDDERALMPFDGFLSVVVPQYARQGMRPLKICGIHIFEHSSFRRLEDCEIESHFRIVDDIADLRK
jgi:proteasome lid subunit RPN8/RPN11